MKLASFPVLGLAAVVTAPALWQGLVTRELAFDLALTRFLVAVVAVWVALSVVEFLVGEPPARPAQAPPAPDDKGLTPGAPNGTQDLAAS